MFDFSRSQREAAARLGPSSRRRRRSDRGRSRLPVPVLAEVRASAGRMDRPSMAELQEKVSSLCARSGLRTPSRASLYNAFATLDGHSYAIGALPPAIREVLYNLATTGSVPGR